MSKHTKTQTPTAADGRAADESIPPYEPSLEEIQARAHQIYVQRGQIDGFDLDDWLQAEKELQETTNEPKD